MLACRFLAPGEVRVENVPEPAAGPGEAILRVAAASLCASDVRVYRGEKHATAGVVVGHEFCGTVVEAGADSLVRTGDALVVCPILACGRCLYCARGERNRCPQRRTLGYDVDGGMAEYVRLPAPLLALGHAWPAPPGLPVTRAALVEPSACVLGSLERARVGQGSRLLVLGCGPMGLLHVALARRMGALAWAFDPAAARVAVARRLGARVLTDVSPARVADEVDAPLDAIVVAVGDPAVAAAAVPLARPQATVSWFAGFPPGATATLDANAVHYGERVVTGSQNARPEQYERVARMLASMPEVDSLITDRWPIEDAWQAYEARLGGVGLKGVVLPGPSAEGW